MAAIMKLQKRSFWITLWVLLAIILIPSTIYFTLFWERNLAYDEDYTGIIIDKFISESNRNAHVIVTLNTQHYNENHYVGNEIYDAIEVGDSVRKIKSDTAFVIEVYKLNFDSTKTKKILIDKW
jgi:hypothetical protein